MATTNNNVVWQPSQPLLLLFAAAALMMVGFFHQAMLHMSGYWFSKEEYSHGVLIPFIVGFLIWQKRDVLERVPFTGSWAGVAIVATGILLALAGEFATLYTVIEYALIVVIIGLALAAMGWPAFRLIFAPLMMLFFMVPLPTFMFNNLSAELQLISSAIGVWFIQLFDISVVLEGNVIDLGEMKLQVVEACSGLRYLFPLMAFGFIVAYFFKAPLWQRAIVFVSTVPITIIMNSFRIGAIGVTVEYWGSEMAEGFLHDFEGWIVFMACAALLGVEMWVLTRLTGDHRRLREVFGLELPAPTPATATLRQRPVTREAVAAILILGATGLLSLTLPERQEIVPERESFASFPMYIDAWRGQSDHLQQIYIDELDFSDYLLANFRDAQTQPPVNLYVAYYGSQRSGESAHSPRTCLPGGGWRITSLTQQPVPGAEVNGTALTVNRVLIEMGEQKQLVYYWFQQRGRVVTNEYLVKWYLFWDALTRNRTDGALVRLTVPVRVGDTVDKAEQRLQRLTQAVNPLLNGYIPQ